MHYAMHSTKSSADGELSASHAYPMYRVVGAMHVFIGRMISPRAPRRAPALSRIARALERRRRGDRMHLSYARYIRAPRRV